MKEGEEEDYAVLIYQDTMRRRAEAATAAVMNKCIPFNKKSNDGVIRRTSTRISAAAARNDSSMDIVKGKLAVTVTKRQQKSSKVLHDERSQKKVAKYRRIKLCSTNGCTNTARRGGLCCRHGSRILCSFDGCTNQAQKRGVCIRHGAKKRQCSSEGCTSQAQKKGLCCRHGGKRLCRIEGCTNQTLKGGVCIRHGAKHKRCRSEGCPNQVKQGGVCIRHGAKHKRCRIEGCTNQTVQAGVCIRYGHVEAKGVQIMLKKEECAAGIEIETI